MLAACAALAWVCGCSDAARDTPRDQDTVVLAADATSGDSPRDALVDTPPEAAVDTRAAPDAVDAAGDAVEALDLAALPACVRACDRAVDCAVEVCAGIDWQTASVAFTRCAAECDDASAARLMAEPACDGVLDEVQASLPALAALCDADPCALACRQLAQCVVDECPAVAPEAMPWLVDECDNNCGLNVADILATPCDALVAAISGADPGFAQFCGTAACATAEACGAFAAKGAGCIVSHCSGNADPFESGLQKALLAYCVTAPDCPSPAAVATLVDPALTCDTPPLDQYGTGAPFTALCAGTLVVTEPELRAGCERLATCTFIPPADVDLCAVYLAMGSSPATIVACIEAAGDCAAAAGCLP